MSANIRDRMSELETLVIEKRDTIDNLSGVPFVVFPYPPEKELDFESNIETFVGKLEFNDLNVAKIDLRDEIFTILDNENLLDDVIEVEKINSEDLEEGLNSTLFEEIGDSPGTLIESLIEQIEDADVAVIYRCGILYPFSSISVILSQMENEVSTPVVVFYPAVKEGKNLRFLDESNGTYYRARVI